MYSIQREEGGEEEGGLVWPDLGIYSLWIESIETTQRKVWTLDNIVLWKSLNGLQAPDIESLIWGEMDTGCKSSMKKFSGPK